MIKILITGAEGQVGQALNQEASLQNIDCVAYSRKDLDITSPSMIGMALHRHQPTVVINAAAYTNVERAEEDPGSAYAVNAEAVESLAKASHREDIPLLHLSTDYVFSGEKNAPYVETDPTKPLNVYGASKLAGELAIQKNMDQYIILRTSSVFSTSGHNFVKTMRRLFQEQTEVRVVNDQKSAPTSAIAIAKALLNIARRVSSHSENFSDWGIYHFSGAPDITWYDFAHAIYNSSASEKLKLQTLSPIQSSELNSKVKRPLYSFLNSEKIKDIFDIDPCDWQDDLRHTISFLQQEVASS